jgi:GNAT superfamily N-acetyltransferase
MTAMQLADFALAQRVETFEADSGRACTEAAARRRPEGEAVCRAIGGGWAAYSGKDSPLTQAVAVGMNGEVSDADLDAVTAFYHSRGAPAHLEVCPLAHRTLIDGLGRRGYRVSEFSNVLFRLIDTAETFTAPRSPARVREARSGERLVWTETVAHGFADEIPVTPELIGILSTFGDRPGAQLWLAEVEGKIAGGGALAIGGGLAALCGASTLPEHRRGGIQSALMTARLAEAARQGCSLAYTIAVPGSASHRNAERHGFRVAYTRFKFTLDAR